MNIPCIAPPDTVIYCTDPALENLFLLGTPALPDSVSGNTQLFAFPATRNLYACQTGTISRSWQVIRDPGTAQEQRGPVCTQSIQVRARHDYAIRFPADTTLTCSEIALLDTLYYKSTACDALMVSYQDVRVNLPGETCYKIYRTYRVLNWCEFDGKSSPVLLNRDADSDGRPGDEPLWVLVLPDGHSYLDQDPFPGNGTPGPSGYWASSRENPFLTSRGYWEYQQVIQVVDDVAPQVSVVPTITVPGRRVDCSGDVNLSITVSENCTPDDLEFRLDWDRFNDGIPDGDIAPALVGSYPRFRLVFRMPLGTHSLVITVADRCGNATRKEVNIVVADARAPAPMCISSLITPLYPVAPGIDADGDGDTDRGATTLWASDLISGPAQDCSGPVKYSVHRGEWIESGIEKPDINRSSLVLTCDDRPTVLLYVYAWDTRGNHDYCETFVLLQDNGNQLCPEIGKGSVSGTVKTVRGNPVEGAELLLGGEKIARTLSSKEGSFVFEFLKEGVDYTISPGLESSYIEGVTTYDIVKIVRHILGEEKFQDPYQYLAADVDRSGSVTTLDVIQIRKLVLSVDLAFRDSPSWRFIDASYSFVRPDDPLKEPFPEILQLNALSGNIIEKNIIAIKVGDVTGDALSGHLGPGIFVESPQNAGLPSLDVDPEKKEKRGKARRKKD